MPSSFVPAHVAPPQAQLLDDVVRTLRAWRRAPMLGVLSVSLGVLPLLAAVEQPAVALVAAAIVVLLLGWPCAERLWLLRLWTGRELTLAEAWRATRRCFGRMLVLLLLAGAAGALLLLPLGALLLTSASIDASGELALDGGEPGWVGPYFAAATVLLYSALTFVTPALAYSTDRVSTAVRIGFRLLRASLPATAGYVLLPAIVAAAGTALSYRSLDAVTVLATLASALLLGLARGATAAYYVRVVPGAGPDGAIRMGPRSDPYAARW